NTSVLCPTMRMSHSDLALCIGREFDTTWYARLESN
ncbi:MAG: hypothetical protein ACI85I_000732, partial [Arenicella sp.]